MNPSHVVLQFKKCSIASFISFIKHISVNSVDLGTALLEFISSLAPRGLGSFLSSPAGIQQLVSGFEVGRFQYDKVCV